MVKKERFTREEIRRFILKFMSKNPETTGHALLSALNASSFETVSAPELYSVLGRLAEQKCIVVNEDSKPSQWSITPSGQLALDIIM